MEKEHFETFTVVIRIAIFTILWKKKYVYTVALKIYV